MRGGGRVNGACVPSAREGPAPGGGGDCGGVPRPHGGRPGPHTHANAVARALAEGGSGMAVPRRRRGGGVPPPSCPPPPPSRPKGPIVGRRGRRGTKRDLQSGKSDGAMCSTHTFGSQTPPPFRAPVSSTAPPEGGGVPHHRPPPRPPPFRAPVSSTAPPEGGGPTPPPPPLYNVGLFFLPRRRCN